MSTKFWPRVFSFIALAGMLISLGQPTSARALPVNSQAASGKQTDRTVPATSKPSPVQPAAAAGAVEVVYPLKADVSPALRNITPKPVQTGAAQEIPNLSLPKINHGTPDHSTVAPDKAYPNAMPTPVVNFEGIHNTYGVQPPDTEGDVGPNNYVQWVNLGFEIWDKAGNSLYGPANGNTLWSGFGGACENSNNGDPIALYDPLADRWLMSQFALPNFPNGPFYQCIAISTTADPTGAWYRYAYQIPVNKMNDYPKFGVWPDAYYMTVNQFNAGTTTWGGLGVGAFERQQMLVGNPAARLVYLDVGAVTLNYGGALPADLDGPPNGLVPPANAPGLFMEWDDSATLGDPTDMIRIWQFHVDWTTPLSSTFGANANYDPDYKIPTDNVDPDMCGGALNCIPQPGTTNKLDAISDRLMYRLQYRNFGGYQTLVSNHTVDVDDTDRAGVHWFELHDTGAGWTMYQQGVFSPDTDNRWMASAALDHTGDIAVGYSVSSSATYPSVRYAGRLVGDPLGTLAQGEASLVAGTGSQTSFTSRWGDYSMLGVDPTDDCTFWYTQEYYQANGSDWRTRVGSFKFPSCSIGPTGTLSGTVTNSASSDPISGALVTATSSPTQTFGTITGGAGTYEMDILSGTYTVTASAFGFSPKTVIDVAILTETLTTQDFALDPIPTGLVQGYVTDANTGWPLYASITIDGVPGNPLWTNPETGYYSTTLPLGVYTFTASAFYPGYLQDSADVTVTVSTNQDFALDADLEVCSAPGYKLTVTGGAGTGFKGTTLPAGWSVINNSGNDVWRFDNPGGRTNYTGGSGNFAIADSDHAGLGSYMDTELWSPVMDFTGIASVPLSFKSDYYNLGDTGDVDVSANGGTTWTNVLHWTSSNRGPTTINLDISAIAGNHSNVVVRWHYYNASWAYWWEVDDVSIGSPVFDCSPQDGGLVVGNVHDANTTLPLVGANVASDEGASFTTIATPLDPAVEDGFYYLFALTGSHELTASLNAYQPATATVPVPHYDAIGQDFNLDAGRLSNNPGALDVNLVLGTAITQALTLNNQGGASASFEFKELDKGMQPLGPFESPQYVMGEPFEWNNPDAADFAEDMPPLPVAQPLAAGDIITSWVPTANSAPWGLAFDKPDSTVWVAEGWGSNVINEYGMDGIPTGRSYSFTWNPVYGPADATFNWNTGMIWSMDVGGDNCIHEIDPAYGVTGKTICPTFTTSMRGLAYDPSSDTYYAGSWNDLMIHHFASDGTMLDEVNVGLPIAGLAYNSDTQHLFVMTNASPNWVYVLDAANNYAGVGYFSITGFDDYSGAGLEMDCSGHLWAVNRADAMVVYEVDSGETTSMCTKDFVPWLSESPITGTITAAGVQNIVVTFDAGVPEVAQPGVYNAQLMIVNDTPYVVANIPITMTVVTATYGVTISPDDSKTGFPGEVVVYEVVITNTGDGPTDSFTMTLGASAWTTNLDIPVVGPLDPGESATVHVSVIVPLDAAPPDQDTAHVTVTSVGDPTKSAVAVLTTSVTMTNIYLPLILKVYP